MRAVFVGTLKQLPWLGLNMIAEDSGVNAQAPKASIVVLGFGNILLKDDGAGVHAVERLRQEAQGGANPPFVANDLAHAAANPAQTIEFVDAGTLSFSLLPLIEGASAMLVIDAANLDAPAGSVESYENEAMDRFLLSNRRRTVHEVGLIDLLDMARLRDTLPQRRALVCIQPQSMDWGQDLSPPVARGMDEVARRASQLLQRWRQ